MTYLLLEGEFPENEKIQGLSDKAFRLHVTALTHCARNLTNGAISEIDLRKLGAISKIGRPNVVVSQLKDAGLWVRSQDGWTIHDYLVHNPSRQEILKKRALARSRKRKWRNERNAGEDTGRNAGQDADGTRHKPPAGRLPSNEGKPPKAERPSPNGSLALRCEACGETYGEGHLEDCPKVLEAAARAARTHLTSVPAEPAA